MLGVRESAYLEDMRKAKTSRVLQCHPDKTDCPGADRAFELVVEASDVLLNWSARRKYDSDRSVAAAFLKKHRLEVLYGSWVASALW